MILGKAEINKILIEDAIANRRQSIRTKPHGDETWRFIVLFRKCQYHDKKREKSIINRFLFSINYFFYHRLSVRLGFSIPYKTQIGPGLSIPHYGSIVISDKAQIGKYCRIHVGVNIGENGGNLQAPKIGDYVYIGPGAKVVGDIMIADGVALGAGAVIVKSIEESFTTWAGVPGKKISDKSSKEHLSKLIDYPERMR